MAEKFVGVRRVTMKRVRLRNLYQMLTVTVNFSKKKKETTRQTTRELFFFRGGEGRRLVQVSGYFVAINTEHVQDITA
jgi:hypothetical protein